MTGFQRVAGIIIAVAAVIVMPVLAKAKRRVAAGIGSGRWSSERNTAAKCGDMMRTEPSWPASAAVTLNIIDVPAPKKGIEA